MQKDDKDYILEPQKTVNHIFMESQLKVLYMKNWIKCIRNINIDILFVM